VSTTGHPHRVFVLSGCVVSSARQTTCARPSRNQAKFYILDFFHQIWK
jgi:hypothetical protein